MRQAQSAMYFGALGYSGIGSRHAAQAQRCVANVQKGDVERGLYSYSCLSWNGYDENEAPKSLEEHGL